MTFDDFGLASEILSSIEELGYQTPTEIQSRVIPLVLEGKDILGRAQTGTGKTASFILPLLHILKNSKEKTRPFAPKLLILAPTRELAAQVHKNALKYGQHLDLKTAVVYGGVPIHAQIRKLKRGVDILIATPGRLLDHVKQQTVDLSSTQSVVLDEADSMLDMGFIHDIRQILSTLPEERQTLLFSATFTKSIRKLAEDLLTRPAVVEVNDSNRVSEQVEQTIHPVDRARKSELLHHLIEKNGWPQVLVFTRTKHTADRLCEKLRKEKVRTDVIHGDKPQRARSRALRSFKDGKVQILVATDIAARGLDIHQLPCVINFELPFVASDYVHRIGRTGRAGNQGTAISLVSKDERKLMGAIEQFIKVPLTQSSVQGFEVDHSIQFVPSRPKRKRSSNFNGKPKRKSSANFQQKKKWNKKPRKSNSAGKRKAFK